MSIGPYVGAVPRGPSPLFPEICKEPNEFGPHLFGNSEGPRVFCRPFEKARHDPGQRYHFKYHIIVNTTFYII